MKLQEEMERYYSLWYQSQSMLHPTILHLILLELEKAQERRTLTTEELEFKRYLKVKSLGFAAIQRARARQHSQLSWIQKGDGSNS